MALRSETSNLFVVLANPSEVFNELNQSPRWKMAFILATASSIAVGWFMIPAIEEPLRKIYARSFGDGPAGSAAASMMRQLMVATIVAESAFKVLRWTILASTMYCLSKYLTGKDDRLFKRLFAVVAYSEIVFIVMSLLNLLVLYGRGLDRIKNSTDLTTVNKGLEFLVAPGSNPPLTTLLTNINVFSMLYVAILSIGISIATGLTRSGATGIAALAWGIWIVICMAQPFAETLFLQMISSYV